MISCLFPTDQCPLLLEIAIGRLENKLSAEKWLFSFHTINVSLCVVALVVLACKLQVKFEAISVLSFPIAVD